MIEHTFDLRFAVVLHRAMEISLSGQRELNRILMRAAPKMPMGEPVLTFAGSKLK